MLLLSVIVFFLHLVVTVRASQFFMTKGDTRDTDRTVAAFLLATSLMFLLARTVSYLINPASSMASTPTIALWNAYGVLNGMFYLGLLSRMIDSRTGKRHRCRVPRTA